MMFSSKTARDLNHDPEPDVLTYNGKDEKRVPVTYAAWATPYENNFGEVVERRHGPRTEFDHVQHNEPNPLLVDFRVIDAGRNEYGDWVRDFDQRPEFWTRGHTGAPSRYPQYTPEQVAHARRVLERLAALHPPQATVA